MSNITIQIESSEGIAGARFATNDPQQLNTVTRGESVTWEVELFTDTLTVESGETYTIPAGETEYYESVVVNGTLTVNGTLYTTTLTVNSGGVVNDNGTINTGGGGSSDVIGFGPLHGLDEYAGKYNRIETLTAEQHYIENTPSGAATLVLGFKPANDLQSEDIPGVWLLLDNVEDVRPGALTTNRLRIQGTVVSEYSEYSDLGALQSALDVTQ